MNNTHCFIHGCKTTAFNKAPSVNFYSCPTSSDMRNKWLHVLKNKCSSVDWSRSKICSKHFEHKYIDSHRRLKDNAIPTLFPASKSIDTSKFKLERLLSRMTQSELSNSIKEDLQRLNEPYNLENFVDDNLRCKSNNEETMLWLVIKKQEHLNARLTEAIAQNKKIAEMLQKTVDDNKNKKKDKDQTVDTYKYIIKCLQEKLATYEEQIEILTSVEAI